MSTDERKRHRTVSERFMRYHYGASGYVLPEPNPERPRYTKVLYKGPPEHATPLWLISCDEGWRQSIVCEGMYEYAADWLLEQIQGKPFAPEQRPDRKKQP